MLSNNVIVQTLAKCCYVSIVAPCDVYKFTVKDLIDLPVYRVKDLIWLACLQMLNLTLSKQQ